jgi:phosphoglycolate phosphatase
MTRQPLPGSFDAVIFDLDGTLADTVADIAEAMDRTLADFELPRHAPAAYAAMLGGGVRLLAERALAREQHHMVERVVERFRVHYRDTWLDHSQPYQGIAELLDALADLPLAVLSNKPHEATCVIVGALFPKDTFVAVAGQRSDVPKKPDPTAAQHIATELGHACARCAFVGDTAVDMQTAVRAGMLPVGVLWGFRDEAELREAGARHLLRHPSELLTLP